MTPAEAGLTRRGWGLLLGAAAMAGGALLFGIQELYPVAAASAVLVLAARGWVTLQQWDVRVIRHVHPARVPAGSPARVELTVRNAGPRRSPPLGAGDPFDGGRRWARFSIAPLAPGETRVASYRLPTTKRGVFRLGPLELEVTDPFRLARAERTSTPDTSLTVHPRVESISTRSMSAHSDHDTRLPQPVIGRGGNEFYGLREYVTGDDLRHVHWPSTARLDDLVIRQPENLWRGRVAIAADLRTGVHDADTLETVLSATASLAISSLAAGLQVRVVTTSGIDTGYAATNLHGPAILDLLAAAGTQTGRGLVDGLRMLRTREPLIVVTTDACPDDDITAAMRIAGAAVTTVVVVERRLGRGQDSAGYSPAGRSRYVRVPPGVSFRAAWEGS